MRRLIVAAEPLSPVKRAKLERMWGAELFDHFGMTEGAFIAGESVSRRGMHVFSDLFHVEVVDESTGAPLAYGQTGALVVTPLWNNSMTPFLRWSSGDLVSLEPAGDADGSPWSLFPILRHARRTVGFFKVRGVNMNHAELEDLMFQDAEVTDFRAEACPLDSGLDVLRLFVETVPGAAAGAVEARILDAFRRVFQVTPEVSFLQTGTIARDFEANVKAPRFLDRRG